MTDYAKDHELTEKMYNDIGFVFNTLKNRFDQIAKQVSEEDKKGNSKKGNSELKYSSALGYLAQVHAGLAKAYHQEKRLAEIEKRLEKIPADVIAKYVSS